VLARAVGANGGLAAGQAAERDADVDWRAYLGAKTGSLFVAAVELGAITSGAAPQPWQPVGAALGAAYQLADDLVDALGEHEAIGKPARQDDRHARPNGARALGLSKALSEVKDHLYRAIAAVPQCPGAEELRAWMVRMAADLYTAHRGPDLARRIREAEHASVSSDGRNLDVR
jgi:geranylgeranyl diphosphate synthase type II